MSNKCVLGSLRQISAASDKFITMKIKEHDLPVLKNHILLFYILPEDGSVVFFNELATKWDISKSSLSDILSKYSKLGYINKCECSEDKRAVYISLTAEGIKISKLVKSVEKEFKEILYSQLELKEQSDFEEIITKLVENTKII